MNSNINVVCEEPIGKNDKIRVLDESSGVISLSRFELNAVNRYVIQWPRWSDRFDAEHADVLRRIVSSARSDNAIVVGWMHDLQNERSLSFNHLNILDRLTRRGWHCFAAQKFGIATKRTGLEVVAEEIEFANKERLGWFLGSSSLCNVATLTSPPLENTARSFCLSCKIAPSQHFLGKIGQDGGYIAYVLNSDDALPSIVVNSSVRIDMSAMLSMAYETNKQMLVE